MPLEPMIVKLQRPVRCRSDEFEHILSRGFLPGDISALRKKTKGKERAEEERMREGEWCLSGGQFQASSAHQTRRSSF